MSLLLGVSKKLRMFNQDTTADNQGFALFYAVVVVAIVSSLGSVLSGLIVREASLSATSRQSSLAYYSADAGIECAQYWDIKEDHFPRGGASDEGDINCAGDSNIEIDATTNSSGDEEYTFLINTSDICADVTVTKSEPGRRVTTIESIGSDRCGTDTRVQRALRNSY